MKTRTSVMALTFVLMASGLNAQFWKKLGKRAADAAEETVLRKVEEKTMEKTEKTMDTILNADQKLKKKRKKGYNQYDPMSEENQMNEEEVQGGMGQVISNKDFVPGNKVLYSDSFANDAIGDFPVTWNTNASAEVVTFEGDGTRWLRMSNSGHYTPDGITDIPENSTMEFDLYVSENFYFTSSGINISLVEVSNRAKDFMGSNNLNGAHLWLHPAVPGGTGRTHISNKIDGEKLIDNSKNFTQFTMSKNLVHVSIWRQKTRMRVYIDDNKVWDIPRAFGEADYNSLVFSVGSGIDDAHFYVANLRLAAAGEDRRHALLETGHFETNEILFDSGLSSLQMGSTSVLDELGQLLEENTDFDLTIVGHTDADGRSESNQKLSEDRARSVKEYLTDNFAIKGSRLQTQGRGADMPVASNDTEDGKQKNRRVEFIKI
jgi:outer membrane protein OmpA-like peptidoglycan-associated protein